MLTTARKGNIGFLVPAGNRVILPEMYRMAGERFGFFETRLMVSGDQISRESNFAMIENIKRGMWKSRVAKKLKARYHHCYNAQILVNSISLFFLETYKRLWQYI